MLDSSFQYLWALIWLMSKDLRSKYENQETDALEKGVAYTYVVFR